MRKRYAAFLALVCAAALSACTFKAGAVTPNANFVYPNSNVETLGSVTASKSKFGVFVAKSLSMRELEDLYRSALAQKNGDILINARIDASVTFWEILPLFNSSWTISGTAARMTVGTQKLGEYIQNDLERLYAQGGAGRAPREGSR